MSEHAFGLLRRFLCAIGLHSYSAWESLYCYHWRRCKRCGHRHEISGSWM